jgi:alcohol dehydrogenase (cytochrome c)
MEWRDEGFRLAYFGAAAPWNSHLRPGDNLYSSSTVAIDPADGKIKWKRRTRQMTHGTLTVQTEFVTFDAGGALAGKDRPPTTP